MDPNFGMNLLLALCILLGSALTLSPFLIPLL